MNKIYYDRPPNLRTPEKEQKNSVDVENSVGYSTGNEPTELPARTLKEFIANIATIVLSIALVINIVMAISVFSDMNNVWIRDEERFWSSIGYGEYTPLVADRWVNEFSDVKETEGLKQCYAVAEYFEAASLYKVAEHTGDSAKKEKYAKIMKEKLAYFSDIMYIAEDINEKLGLE